ncbi:Uncharacterised protein [Klebsiella pneumoniae]|nr:Uncharacterised protein [Klebsiella pneumoniae]
MTTYTVSDGSHINNNQFFSNILSQCSQRHGDFSAHGMANHYYFFNVQGADKIKYILRHFPVSHGLCAR